MRSRLRSIGDVVGCVALLFFSAGPLSAEDGPTLYKQLCASCHDAGLERAPDRDALRAMSPERVLAALESGAMLSMASNRTGVERRAIAEFVTGKSFAQALSTTPSPQAMCRATEGGFADPLAGPRWNGWGVNTANTRYQDGPMAGFTAAEVPRLQLKWAFGFPGELSSDSQPTVVGGRVLRRDAERHRLFAQRGDRLRPLVFSGRRPPCARPSASAASKQAPDHATRRSLATAPPMSMPSMPQPGSCCGKRKWTISRSPGSPAPRRFTTAGSMWASPPAKRRPAPWPITSAADSAAAWSR